MGCKEFDDLTARGKSRYPRIDDRIDHGLVSNPRVPTGKARVDLEFRLADRIGKAPEQLRRGHHDHDISVGDAMRGNRRPPLRRVILSVDHARDCKILSGQHAVHQRDIQELPAPRAFAVQQRIADRRDSVERGKKIRHRKVSDMDPAVEFPVQVHRAAHRHGAVGEASLFRHGPGLAKCGYGTHNQSRVDGIQRFIVQTEAAHDPRPEVLDQNVGIAHEIEHHLAAFGARQIDRQPQLAGVQVDEDHAVPVAFTANPANRVAACGAFYLDDLGSHVGQLPTAMRTRQHMGAIQDTRAAQYHAKPPRARSANHLIVMKKPVFRAVGDR